MKTVTDAFITAQKRPDAKGVRTVEYKRRYWKESTRSFAWETDWTVLSDSYISTLSPVVWQLDTDILNEFKVSNVTLVLDNFFGHFNFGNTDGFFGPDDGSPYHDYEPYWTKFRIKSGFILADGSSETVTVFTGLLSEDPVYDSDTKTVQFTISGLEAILTNSKAEGIATTVTQENIGTGNGSNKDFTTANPGVGGVLLVTVNHLTQTEGADYTISQTNDATLGAKVSFLVAPDNLKVVRATYFYWPQSYQFDQLVEALLISAGISDYDVAPVNFAGSVRGSQIFNTQTDWDTGTKTLVDSAGLPGSIQVDFVNQKQSTTWSQASTGWTIASDSNFTQNWTFDGTNMYAQGSSGSSGNCYASRASTKTTGAWQFETVNLGGIVYFVFMSTIGPNPALPGVAYSWYYDSTTGRASLIEFNTNLSSFTILASYIPIAAATVKIVRYATGRIVIYENGVSKIDITRSTFSTSAKMWIIKRGGATSTQLFKLKLIYIPNDPLTGNWVSPAIDMISTPLSFDPILKNDSTSAMGISYQTRTSTDGISWDAYVDVSSANIPQSALKRYAQVKILFTIAQGSSDTPRVDDITFKWTTLTTAVTLPNFTGISVYEAIQNLGEYTNYEFGFSPDESFFFRPKTSGTPIFDLTQSDYNSRISGLVPGNNNVYGTVRATYGSIAKEITDSGDFPSSPKARVGDRRFEISPNSNIQISPTLDIATGVAQNLFTYFSKPRKRFKLNTKLLPQLDLSDVVSVTMINSTANKLWWQGDNDINLGDKSVFMWGEANQLVFSTPAKIIGARYDTEKYTCEFDLEEVL